MALLPPAEADEYASASDTHDLMDLQDQQDTGRGITPSYYTPISTPTSAPTTTPRTSRYAPVPHQYIPSATDKFTVDPTREAFTFRPTDINSDEGKTYWSDYAKTAWNGARQMGSDLLGAVNYAQQQVSSDPAAQTWTKSWQKTLEDDIAASVKSMSPAAQRATHASLFGNDPNAPMPDDVSGWAQYIGINIASQVPNLLSFFIPGVGGAKGVQFAGKLLGFAKEAAVAAGKVGGSAATAGFFTAQGAGALYNTIAENIRDATPEQMKNNPVYQDLIGQNMTDVQAREEMIKNAARIIVPVAGMIGGVAGSGVSGMITHGAAGTAGRGVLARAGIGAAEGAGLMGTQSAADEGLAQTAATRAGTQQDFDPAKIAKAFASGALPGLVFGAVGGVMHKGIDDTRSSGQLPSDERAATEAALGTQGELDLNQAPAGITTNRPQGELFQTTAEANPPVSEGRAVPMTGEPAPPPQPMNTPTMGMPGARQGELPINQAPPTIVPTTGQGEMFPSLAEANPPRRPGEPPPPPPGGAGTGAGAPPAATSAAAQTAATAGLPTGPVDTARVAAAATPPAAAAKAAATSKAAAPIKPTEGIPRKDMVDDLVGMTGRKADSFKGMSTKQIAEMHALESAKVEAAPEAQAGPKLAGAEAPAESPPTVTPGVESKPAVGEKPLPDQPGASITPQAEAASAEPGTVVTGEAGVAPEPEGRGFTTAKGSTYTLHDDGTTTRDKAYRPEHGIDEQGVQPRSEKTIYVSAEDAQKLGSDFQSQGGSSRVIAQHSSGAWGVRYTAGKDAGKFERRTMVKPLDGPAVGATPVELWNKGKRAHFGNEITEMRGEVTPEVKPKVEAKPAPTKLAALMEKREQKREELPPGKLVAPKAAEAAAKAKLPEAKPVDTEALAKAKATRDEEVKAAETARKEADAEKLALIKQRAAEVKAGREVVATEKIKAMQRASGESYAVETERGARAAETEERAAEGGHEAEAARTEGAQEVQQTGETPIATQVYGEAKEKERATGTTDRERIQNDLVDKIASGEMTGPEAHAEYEADRRKGGAQRREGLDTVAEGITRRLEQAKNKDLEMELLRQQQEHEDNPNPKLSPRQKQHRTEELKQLLENFDPDRIERLENALKEIHDPVGHAVENAPMPKSQLEKNLAKVEAGGGHTRNVLRAMYEIEGLGDRLPKDTSPEDRATYERQIMNRRGVSDKDLEVIHKRLEALPKRRRAEIEAELARRHAPQRAGDSVLRQGGVSPEGLNNPQSSRFVRMANDPRLSEDLRRDIRASEEHGVDYTPKAALETILRSSALKVEQRPLWELARKLYDRVNDSIPIISFAEAARRGYRSIFYDRESGPQGTQGYYDHTGPRADGVRHIGINLDSAPTAQVILHEIAHSVTTERLNHLLRTDPNHREIHALRTIGTELANHARLNRETISPDLWSRLVHTTSDVREVHTWLLTNPEVQAFAASHQASPQFRKIMAELGYTPRPHGNSIWRYFVDWTRNALGFDKPKSASEYTLLDHIMQPVTDILDASIKHNEGIRSNDPVVRAHAEPLLHASTDRLRDTGRSVLERIRPSNLPDRLFNAVTGATNVDAITSLHKDNLPGLVDHQRVRDKIAKASTDAANNYGDRVRGLLKTWGGLSDQKELGSLMNRASLGEMHLGDDLSADANKHLTTPEQLSELRQGQADYANLSPAAKDFYTKARDLYKETYKESREAELEGSLRAVIPDVTDAQAEAFAQAARNKETLANFMADPDNSEIARAFGDKWSENRDLAKMIARAHSYGYTRGDYFPQRRYGKYVVKYGTGDNQGVEFFDRKSKAEDRRAELVRQYGDRDVFQVTRHNQKFTQDILATHPAVGELESALTRKGLSAKQAELARDTLAGILVNHMADGQAARMRLKRQGIPGASIDHGRVLSHEFINHINRIGYLRHGAERQATFDNLWAQQRDLERPGAKPDLGNKMAMVIQSLEKRVQRPEDMNNSAQRNLAHVNAFNYVLSLMSPSHMVTATMEAHTNSIALLAGRHGVIRSSAAVARNLAKAAPILGKSPDAMLQAMKHNLSTSNWNVLDMLAKRFKDAPGANRALVDAVHKMLADTGLVDHTMTSDLRRQMNPEGVFGGKVAGMWERVSDTNQIMAHYVDAINRFVSAYSAAELEHAKTGGDIGKSVEYAEKTARRVAPNYMAGNRELLTSAKGPLGMLGAPLMQFKRYGLHMYAMMGTLIKESMRSGTSAERWEARKSLAYLMASHAMMAGVLGLPTTDAIRYLGGAWDLLHGRDPHNYENSMRAAIAHVVGPQMGELISRGLPHALGFDVHRRVSLNNLMEMPELSNFGKKGITEALMHLVTGATGENLANIMEGAGKLAQLDFGGLKNALPRVVRDPYKAIQLASKGVTDSKGHTILPPSKLSYGDYALQAVGFQPARVSEFREGRNAVLEARQEQSAERSQLETRWMEGSPSERASAWQAIVAYNATHPTARITRDQLLQQEKAGKKSGATMGLRLPKKGAAALMQAGSFANAN